MNGGGIQGIMRMFGQEGQLWDPLIMTALMLLRILPIVYQTPFLGGKLIPNETRMGISIGLVLIIWPFASDGIDPQDFNPAVLIALMFKEVFLGFMIGFIASELFYAMEVGGRALDTMRGSNMAEVQVPELSLRVSPISQFSFQLLLAIFCVLNGHAHFIESIINSFMLVPIDQFPAFTGGFKPVVEHIMMYTQSMFGIAFALVFPGMFAAFLTDVVFGMFNRIAPQLNAYFMAMGVKALGGIAMFMLPLTIMSGQLAYRLEDSLVFIRRIVQFMD